jgi:hypothetical protein
VLFDAENGRIYALNPAAGLTWLCVRDGLSGQDSAVVLANGLGIDRATAREWFRISMNTFRDLGLLATAGSKHAGPVSPAQKRSPTPSSRTVPPGLAVEYRLFDRIVRVAAARDPLAAVDSLLAGLRVNPANGDRRGCSEIKIDIVAQGNRWDLVVDGQIEATCELASLAAEVERLLLQNVVPATPHLLTLHAAALQRDGRTLLLAGPSGAGKTTLSLALARAGWSFGSDEIVLVGRDFNLRPLPLPPCIKADAFGLIETWFPELRSSSEHERYGRIVKYLPIKSAPLPALPGSVVFIRFDPGGATEIQPVAQFSALERLLAQCVFVPHGFQHDDVEELLRWHGEQRYFDLAFSDCDTAVAALSFFVGPRRRSG